MSRLPPPRLDTAPKLPRDPSNWVDRDLLTYIGLNYSTSESSSAVEFVRHNRLTPQALWYLQSDPDELSHLTPEQSLRDFVLSLAQTIQPAVSPTTPRVKHIRRLSHDFEHPPPPPTPPPPSPSLPEEPECEEDDDVAESVISDWALDGDNDEIHEAAEVAATPEPAATQHADPDTGENTLGLDIGGGPTRASEPVEPTPEPAASTTSTEESLIDFEDAPETTSQASLEHSTDAADPVAQPAEVDTARHGSADLQVIEEPAAVQPSDPEGVSTSVNVPEATEEPPSDALNHDDPPPADKDGSTGAGSGDAPGMVSFNDDLGDPWASQSKSETQAGPSEESPTLDVTRKDEGTDSEVHVKADTGLEPAAPTESGSSTSSSLASTMEATGPETARDVPAELKGDAASPLKGDRSRPAVETRDKELPTPPESPEDVRSAEHPASSTPIKEPVVPATEAHPASPSGDQNEDASRGDGGEHADHRDMFSTQQQDEEPLAEVAPPAVQHDTDTPTAAEVVESTSQEKHSPQSPSSVAVELDTQTADVAPSGDKRLPEDGAGRGRSKTITSLVSEDLMLSTDAGSTPDTPSTGRPLGSAASNEKTELEELRRDAAAGGSEETSGRNGEIGDTEGGAEAQMDTHGGQRVAEAGEEEGTRISEAPTSTESDHRLAEEPKMEDADDRVHTDALRSQPSDIHEDDLSGRTGSAEDAQRSSERRHSVPSPPSAESKEPPVVSDPPISSTVTLADGAEVLIVGRDSEREDETGKATTFPVPSSAAVPIAVTTPATAFHSLAEVDSGSTTRSSPTPWPASPGVNALARTARSPPPLKTDFPSRSTSERSLSRSAVFSPQHHQMLVQTPTSSVSKSPAWGFKARSIFSSVTSAFASGPVSPHSSPSSTRDSSQEPTTVPRADNRATPPARTQIAWGGNKQRSPALASPSFGQLRVPSPSTPPVVEQQPDQTTSLQPVAKGEPAVAKGEPAVAKGEPAVAKGEPAVAKELSEAMSDGVPGLREGQLQNSESESANPRSGSPTRNEFQLPDAHSGDADAEDFVQVGPNDLAGEGCTSDDVKRDEVATSEHVLSSGHAGVSTAGDGGSSRSNGMDADDDTPLAHVSRLLKATPQTPSSEPTSDVEDDMDGPESPLELETVRRLRTTTGDVSEGPDSPSVDASDNPAETEDTTNATNSSKKKKKKKAAKKNRRA